MILDQYYLSCLSHASYMIADETSKIAAIVDPQRDIDQYLADAKAKDSERLDAAKQVRGDAGDYQVEGARRVQTLNIGGSATTTVSFIVERDAA